jgi:uncharacterized membrane protein
MKIDRDTLWLFVVSLPAIVGISLIIFFSVYEAPRYSPSQGPMEHMPPRIISFPMQSRIIPSYLLWISLILMVLIVVPLSYYFLSKRVDKKLEHNMEIISKLMNGKPLPRKTSSDITEREIILKFLNENERKVLEKLIENEGSVLQSEISRMAEMTTLKTHRAIKDLEKKGIIKKESYGKTNRIILIKEIKDVIVR